MSALMKAVHVSKTLGNVTKLFANLSVSSSTTARINAAVLTRVPTQISTFLHTSSSRNDLMEFFDEEENWKKDYVKSGRPWRKDDLRIKSNEDLHKLWFVLLKERNMLMTMESMYIHYKKPLISPERLDKVEESMENIEAVVRERNKAYYMLETGEDGERPAKLVYSPIGLQYYYRMSQHRIPKFMNTRWQKNHKFGFAGFAVRKFLHLYREKKFRERYTANRRDYMMVRRLFRLYENLDIDAVKKQYPHVNVNRIQRCRRAQGHFEPRQT